jgi:HK97 family phage prohead protease
MNIPIDAEGRFAGYASLFHELDQGGDIVMPGAFAGTLRKRGSGQLRMLFQHDPREPVGIWEGVAEDRRGLWVEGRLVPGVPRADALRRLIENRAIDGLSIGFRTVKATREPGTGLRRLWQIDLWEVSIVTFPMMAGARIADAKRPERDARLNRSLSAAISLLRQ